MRPQRDPEAQPTWDRVRPGVKAEKAPQKPARRKGGRDHGRPKMALGGHAHQVAKASTARLRTRGLARGRGDDNAAVNALKSRYRNGMRRLRAISSGG